MSTLMNQKLFDNAGGTLYFGAQIFGFQNDTLRRYQTSFSLEILRNLILDTDLKLQLK